MEVAYRLKSQVRSGQQGSDDAPANLAGANNQSPVNANAAPVLDNKYRAAQQPGQTDQGNDNYQHPNQ
jgi:hypothetical protein